MTWRLFLDDCRCPPNQDFEVARSDHEARELVLELGCPSFMSLDFHLGAGHPTGLDFARWLVEMDRTGIRPLPEDFSFEVHSSDPVGSREISRLLVAHLKRG